MSTDLSAQYAQTPERFVDFFTSHTLLVVAILVCACPISYVIRRLVNFAAAANAEDLMNDYEKADEYGTTDFASYDDFFRYENAIARSNKGKEEVRERRQQHVLV